MSDWSKYANYHQRRQPRKRSAKAIYGEKEDTGRWFFCRHCGFRCNIDRDSLDTGETGSTGARTEDYPEEAAPYGGIGMADPLTNILVEEGKSVLMEISQDTSEKVIKHNNYPTTTGGCPLCGSMNWR